MKLISKFTEAITAQPRSFWIVTGAVVLCIVLLGILRQNPTARKHSVIGSAVASVIDILLIYALVMIVFSGAPQYMKWLPSLPLWERSESGWLLYTFSDGFAGISRQLVRLFLLSLLINLFNSILPAGKHFITRILFRLAGIALGLIAHYLVLKLLGILVPEGFLTYAPAILFGILVLMLLTGVLKLLVGAAIAAANPIIGALYTFFFANMIGKQVTKAVLTAGVLSLIVLGLGKLGITVLPSFAFTV